MMQDQQRRKRQKRGHVLQEEKQEEPDCTRPFVPKDQEEAQEFGRILFFLEV